MRILNKDLFFIFIVLVFVFSLKNILESFFLVSPSLLHPFFMEPFLMEADDEERKLVQLQMVIRHGHRAPYQSFPSNPHSGFIWKEGYQSLTLLGRLQNFAMGDHLRKVYNDFITTNPKETIFARAQCSRGDEERDALHASKIFNETKERFSHFYRYLSFHAGGHVENCFGGSHIAKTLMSQEAYNLTSPIWARLYWEELQYQIVLNYYFLYATKILLRFRVGNLLKHMIGNIERRINKEDVDTRVIVYSGHGSTINLILFSLNRFNFLETPTGSVLVTELWKERKNRYSVRWLLFNSSHPERHIDPPVPLHFDDCGGEFCSVENLINRIKDFIPVDWESECNYEVPIALKELDFVANLPYFGLQFGSSSASSLVSVALQNIIIVNVIVITFYLSIK
ncbi:prostatic acid phosphatase-like isoform X2 [Parasteatoda tepidariorum]|uniref:prostatic acid phosphatase-like isoform X2 n=1 Tax=Parasteatoda tepidariorum TaxID=114398 RepID=UPI0039BD49D7